MTGESIELTHRLQAPVDRVWAALIDPAQAGRWFAAKANIVPELGAVMNDGDPPLRALWRTMRRKGRMGEVGGGVCDKDGGGAVRGYS